MKKWAIYSFTGATPSFGPQPSLRRIMPMRMRVKWDGARNYLLIDSGSRRPLADEDDSASPLTDAHAQKPAAATAAAKRQTPPRTPSPSSQSEAWLCAALLCGFGLGGSSAGQTSLSRTSSVWLTRLHAAPSAKTPFFHTADTIEVAAVCGEFRGAESAERAF